MWTRSKLGTLLKCISIALSVCFFTTTVAYSSSSVSQESNRSTLTAPQSTAVTGIIAKVVVQTELGTPTTTGNELLTLPVTVETVKSAEEKPVVYERGTLLSFLADHLKVLLICALIFIASLRGISREIPSYFTVSAKTSIENARATATILAGKDVVPIDDYSFEVPGKISADSADNFESTLETIKGVSVSQKKTKGGTTVIIELDDCPPEQIQRIIKTFCKIGHITQDELLQLIEAESKGDPNAHSGKAVGRTQITTDAVSDLITEMLDITIHQETLASLEEMLRAEKEKLSGLARGSERTQQITKIAILKKKIELMRRKVELLATTSNMFSEGGTAFTLPYFDDSMTKLILKNHRMNLIAGFSIKLLFELDIQQQCLDYWDLDIPTQLARTIERALYNRGPKAFREAFKIKTVEKRDKNDREYYVTTVGEKDFAKGLDRLLQTCDPQTRGYLSEYCAHLNYDVLFSLDPVTNDKYIRFFTVQSWLDDAYKRYLRAGTTLEKNTLLTFLKTFDSKNYVDLFTKNGTVRTGSLRNTDFEKLDYDNIAELLEQYRIQNPKDYTYNYFAQELERHVLEYLKTLGKLSPEQQKQLSFLRKLSKATNIAKKFVTNENDTQSKALAILGGLALLVATFGVKKAVKIFERQQMKAQAKKISRNKTVPPSGPTVTAHRERSFAGITFRKDATVENKNIWNVDHDITVVTDRANMLESILLLAGAVVIAILPSSWIAYLAVGGTLITTFMVRVIYTYATAPKKVEFKDLLRTELADTGRGLLFSLLYLGTLAFDLVFAKPFYGIRSTKVTQNLLNLGFKDKEDATLKPINDFVLSYRTGMWFAVIGALTASAAVTYFFSFSLALIVITSAIAGGYAVQVVPTLIRFIKNFSSLDRNSGASIAGSGMLILSPVPMEITHTGIDPVTAIGAMLGIVILAWQFFHRTTSTPAVVRPGFADAPQANLEQNAVPEILSLDTFTDTEMPANTGKTTTNIAPRMPSDKNTLTTDIASLIAA